MFQVGDELGRYEIIAHLKSGGMAALYLGRRRDPGDNRIFAIKVVHSHLLDDSQLVDMFLDEARLSARIDHPNVVKVEEMGEDGGVHFLVMEYVHGCSLAQLLQALIRCGRRMQPELAVFTAMSIAEGLHAAHETKDNAGELLHVVHRDVSPQNVLLSHTGEVKLIDFGIAKSRARLHHSMTGISIRGKLRYMSPEHAKGQSVDRRTDVYALGIVLWEMLTMRPLFWAETDFEVLSRVQDPKIDPPSRYSPRIPGELDEAVLEALQREKGMRPQTAFAFRQLLSRAVPFAEALDAEQVADLLDAVIGEEIASAADDIPEEASVVMGIEKIQGMAGGRQGRDARATRPITQRALEELTVEFRDASISVDSFADDDAPGELASGEQTPMEEPTELMSREALAQIHAAFDPGAPSDSLVGEAFRLRNDTDRQARMPIPDSEPPTEPTLDARSQDAEFETAPTGVHRGSQPPPVAEPPPPEWMIDTGDDGSVERLALLVGAGVAALLLVIVGLFVLL